MARSDNLSREGKERRNNGSIYSKDTAFPVLLPLVDDVKWPKRCALCGAKKPKKTTYVMDSWRSGNYLVAKTRSWKKFEGVPLCTYCHKETAISPMQNIMVILGIILGIGISFGIVLIDESYICAGCFAGLFIAVTFFLIGVLALGRGMRSAAVELKVGSEGNNYGKNRATKLLFKFRNPSYAADFMELNTTQIEKK